MTPDRFLLLLLLGLGAWFFFWANGRSRETWMRVLTIVLGLLLALLGVALLAQDALRALGV